MSIEKLKNIFFLDGDFFPIQSYTLLSDFLFSVSKTNRIDPFRQHRGNVSICLSFPPRYHPVM